MYQDTDLKVKFQKRFDGMKYRKEQIAIVIIYRCCLLQESREGK